MLKNIISPNFFYLKLFRVYSSYNLNKFILNKNFFNDIPFQYYCYNKGKVQKYDYKDVTLLKRSFINTNNDLSLKTADLLLNKENILINYNNLLNIYNYFILKEFMSVLVFLIFINSLNLYKLYLYIILK